MNGQKEIFNFNLPYNSGDWNTINDIVMGGISNSTFKINISGTATFSGYVSLENNGGFASVRSSVRDNNFESFSGFLIRIKGDGKNYNFRLRTDSNFDGISYHVNFTTEADEWVEVTLPFINFIPMFRGRIIRDAPDLNPKNIKQLGFLISDKQSGNFELTIDWIKVYKQ